MPQKKHRKTIAEVRLALALRVQTPTLGVRELALRVRRGLTLKVRAAGGRHIGRA